VKALVVDDEAPARRRLARMLRELQVEVTAELENGEGVLRVLETQTVDAIFLDIRMPGMDGLTLARRYSDLPAIVFVTAYDQYAVNAFDVNAVDYLLKPIRPDRLATAVERVRTRQTADSLAIRRALAAVAPSGGGAATMPRVVSSQRGLIKLFDAREVTRFWASDKYTQFLADGAEQLTEEPLGALEERLREHSFVRIHRAELVRADAIRALRLDAGGHTVQLSDGQSARVSRRALSTIKAALGLS
jgi:DNA-binding LytR/AlgR family response regulator